MREIVVVLLLCPSLVVAQVPAGSFDPRAAPRRSIDAQVVLSVEQVVSALTSVTLRWAAVTGAASYQVSRAIVAEGPFAPVGSVAVPEFTDRDLVPGYTFHYQIVPSSDVLARGATNLHARMTVTPTTSTAHIAAHPSDSVILEPFTPITGVASTAPAPALQVTAANCTRDQGYTRCDFSWPAAPAAVGYRVYRKLEVDIPPYVTGACPPWHQPTVIATVSGGAYRAYFGSHTCAVSARALYRTTHAGAALEVEGPDTVFPFPSPY